MKDLITTIGALMILMMFVVQFANNQSIATRILAADHYADMYEEGSIETMEECIDKISGCFGCEKGNVYLQEKDAEYIIKAPIKNIIACADFLGIDQSENTALYTYIGELK